MKRIPGHLNIADALSRLIRKTQVDQAFDEENDKHVLYALDVNMDISWTDIQLASETDEELNEVRDAIHSNKWSRHLRRFEAQAKELRTLDPIIFKDDGIILPKSLQNRALDFVHHEHIIRSATKRIMSEYF